MAQLQLESRHISSQFLAAGKAKGLLGEPDGGLQSNLRICCHTLQITDCT